jgi:cobalt-zinc-cadmium efflux system protein
MSTTETALTVHLVIPAGFPGDGFLKGVSEFLQDQFGIEHATVQAETGEPDHPCTLAPEERV